MKKGLTELVFIIDKSGSMIGLEADTIGGFNSMLANRRQWTASAISQPCCLTTTMNCSMTVLT